MYMYVYIHIYIYICMYVCIYIYICVHIYIYIYIYMLQYIARTVRLTRIFVSRVWLKRLEFLTRGSAAGGGPAWDGAGVRSQISSRGHPWEREEQDSYLDVEIQIRNILQALSFCYFNVEIEILNIFRSGWRRSDLRAAGAARRRAPRWWPLPYYRSAKNTLITLKYINIH